MSLQNSGEVIVYPNQVPYDTDVLRTNLYTQTGDGGLAATILGVGINYTTLLRGFPCVPVSPPGLSVVVGSNQTPDAMYSLQPLNATAYGSLPVNTNPYAQQFKQGFNWGPVTLATPAPVTTGDSVIHLVQIGFSTQDVNNVNRPYFNSDDKSMPIFNNNYDTRINKAIISLKQGIEGPSPTPPTPDAGFIAAFYITVTFGQTSIVSGNITVVPGAPFITESLTQKISQSTADGRYVSSTALIKEILTYWPDTSGAANTITLTPSPVYPTLASGIQIQFTPAHTNTTTSVTVTINGNSLSAVVAPGITLQPGDLVVGGAYAGIVQGSNLIVLNPSTGNNPAVVTSWNGSTSPVAITAGSNVSINLGVISFTNTSGLTSYDDIRRLTYIHYDDGSSSENIVTITPSPAYGPPTTIQQVDFGRTVTNTGNSTISIGTIGPVPIEICPGAPLTGGEMEEGGIYTAEVSGSAAILKNPCHLSIIQRNQWTTAAVTGTENAIIATLPVSQSAIISGFTSEVTIWPTSANSSPTVTLNVNSTAALSVKKFVNGRGVTNLDIGDLQPGCPATLKAENPAGPWILINPCGFAGALQQNLWNSDPNAVVSGGGLVMTSTPAIPWTSYQPHSYIFITFTGTIASTGGILMLNISGLGAIEVSTPTTITADPRLSAGDPYLFVLNNSMSVWDVIRPDGF